MPPPTDALRAANAPADAAASAPAPRYRRLDEEQIVATIARLRDRIQERFPGSGLSRVAAELHAIAGESTTIVGYLRRPNWLVRAAVGLAIVVMLGVVVAVVATVRVPARVDGIAEFVQLIESGVNDLVFLGLAIFFLLTVEGRLKRRRALAALHELRSVVHIVDMHQLTKDPERLLAARADTASSPERTMSPAQLGRYLDYCSELLSLASKVAALFVQYHADPVVLSAVNEIETLASGFSGKVWQKITLLERVGASAPRAPALAASHTGGPS